ncbi:Transcriptional regulator VspR [Vibrio chagasii]|nr:Transcriptional regulator VspR [Vibrio chagasii]
MSSKPIHLIPFLYQILIEDQLDDFSVLELRDRYLTLAGSTLDKAEARRLVYRHILRLVNKQLLCKVSVKGTKKATYQKTELFSKTTWELTKNNSTTKVSENHGSSYESKLNSPKTVLQERLEQCESDFLACLQEFQTYQGLSSEFPHLKEGLHDVRSKTKIQSSKLVGQIRAIKMALALS